MLGRIRAAAWETATEGLKETAMGRIWTALQFAVAAGVAWWAGLHSIFKILLVLQLLDIISGVLAASRFSSLSSTIGRTGIKRKLVSWLLLMALGVAQAELGPALAIPALVGDYGPAQLMAAALAFMEFVSIVENADRLGVPLPSWLKTSLSGAKRTLGYEERVARDESVEGRQ